MTLIIIFVFLEQILWSSQKKKKIGNFFVNFVSLIYLINLFFFGKISPIFFMSQKLTKKHFDQGIVTNVLIQLSITRINEL